MFRNSKLIHINNNKNISYYNIHLPQSSIFHKILLSIPYSNTNYLIISSYKYKHNVIIYRLYHLFLLIIVLIYQKQYVV